MPVAAAGLQARGMTFAALGAATPSLAPAAAAAAPVVVEVVGSEAVSQASVPDLEEVLEEDCCYTQSWVAVRDASAAALQPLAAATVSCQGAQSTTALASNLLSGVAVLQQAAATGAPNPLVHLATVGAAHGNVSLPCGVPASSGMSCAAAAWALMRPLALEQADWQLTAADVDGASVVDTMACVQYAVGAAAAAATAPADLYGSTTSGGVHYAAQLQLAHPSTAAQAQVLPLLPSAVTAGGSSALQLGLQLSGRHIITGGSGAVAVQVARWLADQAHVSHVQLVSRSGALPTGVADIALGSGSSSRAVAITSIKADVSFTEDVGLVFGSGVHPVVGVYHAAGVLSDALLSNQTPSSVRSVLAAKTAGLLAMQQQLSLQPVSQQVLFSSVAALLGSPGQSNYAAANAALDATAATAVGMGLPALSIQYGAWAGAGMAAREQQTAARAARLGLPLLEPSQALAALRLAASAAVPVVAAVRFTWPVFLSHMRQQHSAFFQGFSGHVAAQAVPALHAALPQTPAAAAAPAEVDAAEVEQQVREAVAEAVESLLGGPVPPEEPLMAAGLDSLGAVELHNMLQESLGAQLPNTLVLDYPTQQALTVHITQQLVQTMPPPSAAAGAAAAAATQPGVLAPQAQLARAVPTSASATPTKEVLLVLAAAQRRPGQQVSGLSAEQELLLGMGGSSSDAIGMVPLERWDLEASINSTAARCALHWNAVAAHLLHRRTFSCSCTVVRFAPCTAACALMETPKTPMTCLDLTVLLLLLLLPACLPLPGLARSC
jgi:acyl carrier protein